MEQISSVLLGCPLFAGVAAAELAGMLACLQAREAAYARGEYIFCEGEPARQMGVVLSGGVQVVQEDYHGDRSIVSHIRAGQLFCETFALAQVPMLPVSVMCTADSRIMLLDCQRLTTTCDAGCGHHQRIIRNLLHATAEKNLHLHQKVTILSRRTTREKLLAYLSAQARLHRSRTFTIPFDRQALADFLCVERSALSAEISNMRKEGVIESEKSRFSLL